MSVDRNLSLRSRRQELDNQRGASAVDSGLLIGLVAVLLISADILLGGSLFNLFEVLATAITD